jgi:DNA-binding winged helix-turn-helix (wHTH) protein
VIVRFGTFVLDSDRRQLTRDGVAIHLTPKAFDLLALLADEAPRVVRKTELHERLWQGSSSW